MMTQNSLLEILLSGKVPSNVRSAVARGLSPLPPEDSLRALVFLTADKETEIALSAKKTIADLDEAEVLARLESPGCHTALLEYFAITSSSDTILQAIVENPATPGTLIESLALTLTPEQMTLVMDNRVRILEFPGILRNIRLNPMITQDIKRLVQEIETELLEDGKKQYSVERRTHEEPQPQPIEEQWPSNIPDLEIEVAREDLSLDGLPVDDRKQDAVIGERLSGLSFRDKIRYALFGNRQVRSLLIRDTNREISRMVLRSPKITEAEIESFSSMRGISEEILRDIGNSKEFTKSYNIAHNLVKNPKTPPVISQRLIFRLRTHDLSMLTRDRGIPEVVRFNAARMLNQRSRKGSN